jgi:hypothetical protein
MPATERSAGDKTLLFLEQIVDPEQNQDVYS